MIAYLDMPSGISGDMFLGCLIDAGWPVADLHQIIERMKLPQGSWQVTQETVQRGPLRATLLNVQVQEGPTHRHLADVGAIINGSELSAAVKAGAVAVFTRLAEAEAWVHGTSIDEVHFHEVGALDAIIDIVGVVAGLASLGIEQLYASGAPLGEGWTRSAHGPIPVPAPATLHLLTGVNAPSRPALGPGELVTPTGAALIAELAEFRQPPMRLEQIGYGAGQKEFAWPNVARLWLGTALPQATTASDPAFVQIETNIDDMNPELYGMVRQRLVEAGALDVWTTPIQMKKERPGVLLSLLGPSHLEEKLAAVLLRETTTLGVRVHPVHRHEADRVFRTVQCKYGDVSVKLKLLNGQIAGIKPEYEQCAELAIKAGVPLQTVLDEARLAALTLLC